MRYSQLVEIASAEKCFCLSGACPALIGKLLEF